MKLSKILLSIGIPLAVILGAGSFISDQIPDSYVWFGVLGIVLVILSFAVRRKDQKPVNK